MDGPHLVSIVKALINFWTTLTIENLWVSQIMFLPMTCVLFITSLMIEVKQGAIGFTSN